MGSIFGSSNVLTNFELANPEPPVVKPPRDPREKPRPIPHEENLQLKCAAYLRREYPDILFSSDAAGFMKLKKEQAVRLKRLNGSRGRPDMNIDYPNEVIMPDGTRKLFYGMRLELKPDGAVVWNQDGTLRKQKVRLKMKNKKTGLPYIVEYDHLAEQWGMIQEYRRLNFWSDFIIGFDHFRRTIDWYVDRKTAMDIESEF